MWLKVSNWSKRHTCHSQRFVLHRNRLAHAEQGLCGLVGWMNPCSGKRTLPLNASRLVYLSSLAWWNCAPNHVATSDRVRSSERLFLIGTRFGDMIYLLLAQIKVPILLVTLLNTGTRVSNGFRWPDGQLSCELFLGYGYVRPRLDIPMKPFSNSSMRWVFQFPGLTYWWWGGWGLDFRLDVSDAAICLVASLSRSQDWLSGLR